MGGKNSYESIKRYEDKTYDKVLVRMPKGRKEIIKDHAESHGESVNGFINRAITETMGRDASPGGAEDHPSACSGGCDKLRQETDSRFEFNKNSTPL